MQQVYGAMLGGALLGCAAGLVLLANGRVAGVSGMVSCTLRPRAVDSSWQITFLLGLVAGGGLLAWIYPAALPVDVVAPIQRMVGAGLLVGFGARLSGGCTSGHGLCGVGRLSGRGAVATLTFMTAGALTVWILRHLLGAL
ncbi:MAG: YeeE/YedE family protein [Terriglobia bacterium]